MADPTPTTNEQIALKLGWTKTPHGSASRYYWIDPKGHSSKHCPDFEHEWAHAGPLQAEMVRELGWSDMCDRVCHQFFQVPDRELTEDISHAWLAWRKKGK